MDYHVISATGPDQVRLVTDTLASRDGTTLLKTACSQISPGTELFCLAEAAADGAPVRPGYIMTGTDPAGKRQFLFPAMENSSGCHCSRRLVGQEDLLLELPEAVSFEDACFLRFINIGLHSLNHLGGRQAKVCVFGLGPVGNIACQTAKILGCQVTGVDLCENRLAIARDCGLDHATTPERLDALENRFDFVLDTVVADGTLTTSVRILKPGGACAMVGIVKPGRLTAADLLRSIWQKDLHFRSGWEMCAPLRRQDETKSANSARPISIEENLQRALTWLAEGRYRLAPLVSGIVKAEEPSIRQAYRDLQTNPAENMSFLIKWD
jgi:threonine dehydrogenase-like Zn-dependent dehydrogenase